VLFFGKCLQKSSSEKVVQNPRWPPISQDSRVIIFTYHHNVGIWTLAQKMTSFCFPENLFCFRLGLRLKLTKIRSNTFLANVHSGNCPRSLIYMSKTDRFFFHWTQIQRMKLESFNLECI